MSSKNAGPGQSPAALSADRSLCYTLSRAYKEKHSVTGIRLRIRIIGDKAQRPEVKEKAEELGVPVLTAEEFFERYGLQEYGREDMPKTLWEILTNGEPGWGVHEKDAESTIRILYAYREWIDPEVLQAVVEKIIKLAERNDPEAAERLLRMQE